jgi:putative copper resistance protein D
VDVPAPSPWTILVPSEVGYAGLLVLAFVAWRYLSWTRRLGRRGRRWPAIRTAAFLGGAAVAGFAVLGGLGRYDGLLFSSHAAQHVLIGMVAPVLLALGLPLTLLLQSAHPRTRAITRRALAHPAARVLTHPVVALALFGASLFVLYFTGLYELSLRNELVHAGVHAHFLAVGLLFATVVIGAEALPNRLPHAARLGLVALTVPIHAVLGLALLSSKAAVAGDYYASLARPDWCGPLLADQRTGAGIMWAAGEVFGLAVAAIVLGQWMRHADREARRHDRRLDATSEVLVP